MVARLASTSVPTSMAATLAVMKYGLLAATVLNAAGPMASNIIPPPQHENVVKTAGMIPNIPIPGNLQLASILLLSMNRDMLSPNRNEVTARNGIAS